MCLPRYPPYLNNLSGIPLPLLSSANGTPTSRLSGSSIPGLNTPGSHSLRRSSLAHQADRSGDQNASIATSLSGRSFSSVLLSVHHPPYRSRAHRSRFSYRLNGSWLHSLPAGPGSCSPTGRPGVLYCCPLFWPCPRPACSGAPAPGWPPAAVQALPGGAATRESLGIFPGANSLLFSCQGARSTTATRGNPSSSSGFREPGPLLQDVAF